MNRISPTRDAHDCTGQAKRWHPSRIDFLSDRAQAVAAEVDLDLSRGQPDEARVSKSITAKELLALTRKRGALLTEDDARAIEELRKH